MKQPNDAQHSEPKAAIIVLNAIRKHFAVIRGDITSFHLDPSKLEDLDEAICLTGTIKCATSLDLLRLADTTPIP